MGFDKGSGKGLRIVCAACVVTGVALAPWLHWVALALAGFGMGIGVPLWLRRSWREILQSTPEKIMGLFRKERARPTGDTDPAGNAREESQEPTPQQPYFPHARSVPKNGHPSFADAGMRPRHSFRPAADAALTGQSALDAEAPRHDRLGPGIAADPETFRGEISRGERPGFVAAARNSSLRSEVSMHEPRGRENPASPAEPPEVIDLQSIMGYLEKRYRGKLADTPPQAPDPSSSGEPPAMVTIEEVERRLKAAGRLPAGGWQALSPPTGEDRQEAEAGSGNETAGSTGVQPAKVTASPGSSGLKPKPLNGTVWPYRPADDSHGRMETTIDITPADPRNTRERRDTPPARASALPSSREPSSMPSSEPVSAAGGFGISTKGPNGGSNDTILEGEHGIRTVPGECPPFSSVPASSPASSPSPSPAKEHPCESAVTPGEQLALRAFGVGNNPFGSRSNEEVCLPPMSLLHPAGSEVAPMSQDDLIEGGILIEEKLAEFRVKVNVQDAYAGPVITRYEVQPAVGVRGGQVVSLMKDLARALGLAAIRVVETIPGKTCMGLELPNPRRQMIHLSEVLSSEDFQTHPSKLAMVLGKDIIGEPVVADLARAPHMLVAGTTGSGKSVGINAMILSLLYRATPEEVRFVMIDPKMLELSIYDGIPHLLAPVVTDMKLAANALNWCVWEMERRYRLMSGLRVRGVAGYNQKIREALDAGEPLFDPASPVPDDPALLSPLPYIVVVVDELADLMMVTGKKIEELIARLAQKARAAGIHLIIATQRPSVDVITGLIKANIPTRIAFQVSSKIDSRTILDQMGAECLLGQGDMLYLPPGTGYPQRVHGAFVADEEVQAVAEYLKQFGEPQYVEGVLGGLAEIEEMPAESERFNEDTDPLYDEAVEFVINTRRASISAVQRQLRIGYNRAARLVEQMEASGLVSPMESNGNRTVLVPARQD